MLLNIPYVRLSDTIFNDNRFMANEATKYGEDKSGKDPDHQNQVQDEHYEWTLEC